MTTTKTLICAAGLLFIGACSSQIDERTTPRGDDDSVYSPPVSNTGPNNGQGNGQDNGQNNPDDPYTVQGRWTVSVSTLDSSAYFLASQDSFPANSTVAPTVRFKVDGSSFAVPADIEEGDISFGEFSLNKLRDNKMNVCGNSGTDRCVEAAIRVYTQGTPDSGFWHAADAYGAPITSDTFDVGLDAANAAIVATFSIPNRKRVVRLKDFTGDNTVPLLIPISVNFDDAGAGDYSSEFVVEYVLR